MYKPIKRLLDKFVATPNTSNASIRSYTSGTSTTSGTSNISNSRKKVSLMNMLCWKMHLQICL